MTVELRVGRDGARHGDERAVEPEQLLDRLWDQLRSGAQQGRQLRFAGEPDEELSERTRGGLEAAGPKFRAVPTLLYLGYRKRDLPFYIGGEVVPEKFYSGGAGIPLAGPRVILDMAIQRATRGPVANVSEKAWILSLGFTVRP